MVAKAWVSGERPGDVVARSKRFDVCSELGRGARGLVYDVFDHELRERFALKLIVHGDPGSQARLESELSLSREVQHPHLVRLHEVGALEGIPYLLMERVLGSTLTRYVGHAHERVDEARLRSCLIQLVGALDALHAAHRVHRDVKPENVRVTHEGRLVLLDFGIAAEREDLVWAEPAVGTPAYMAPEQVVGGPIGPSADLYAVGVILYEALTGVLPHPEVRLGHTAVKLTVEPKRPRMIVPTVSAELDDLCAELLCRDPEQRPNVTRILRRLGAPVDTRARRIVVRSPTSAIGREAELCQLDRAWTQAQQAGTWLHVQGPDGRGKHALLDTFLARVQGGSIAASILRGRCVRGASAYAGLESVMDDLGEAFAREKLDGAALPHARSIGWLAQMFPAFGVLRAFRAVKSESAPVPDPMQRRLRATRLLREIVAELAKRAPIIVCLENVDLSGADLRNLLATVFGRQPGVMMLTSGTAALAPCAPSNRFECLELAPLTKEGATELLAAIFRDALGTAPDSSDDLVQTAAGEPWALIELARAKLEALPSQTSIEDVLTRRLERASQDAHLLLRCLALFGRMVPQQEWLDAVELDERAFHRALFELTERGFVARVGSALEPQYKVAHVPLLKTIARLDPEQVSLGAALARSHSSRNVLDEEERAYLLEQASEAVEAARCYERASAEALRRLAFASAAESASCALRLDPAKGEGGSRRLQQLASLFELSGDLSKAADFFERALGHAAPADVFELKRRRTEALLRGLRVEDGMRSAREALRDLGVRFPETETNAALSLLFQRALLWMRGDRFTPKDERRFSPLELSRIDALLAVSTAVGGASAIGAAELQTRGFRLALREREPRRVARALAMEVSASSIEEAEPHTRSLGRVKLARTLAEGDPMLTAWLDIVEGTAHFFDLHPLRARPLLDCAERTLSDHAEHMMHERWVGKLFRLDTSNLVERFGETEVLTKLALDEARLRGDHHLTSIVLLRGSFPLSLSRDCSAEAASAVIDEAMARWPKDRVYLPHFFALQARGLLAQHRAQPGALAAFEAQWASFGSSLFMRARVVRTVLEGIRAMLIVHEAAATTGTERHAWLRRLRASLQVLARGASGIGRLLPLFSAGTERWLSDRPDEALAHFEHALTLCQERGLRNMQAYAAILSGTLLGGDLGRARFDDARAQLLCDGCRDPEHILRVFLPDTRRG